MLESLLNITDPAVLAEQAAATINNITTALQLIALQSPYELPEWPHSSCVNDGDFFDFIIVGGGTAGLVVANRLTEVVDWNVLVIEAGGDPTLTSVVPGTSLALPHTRDDWNFYNEYDEQMSHALRNQRVRLTRGKVLGGTSAIDHLMYERGDPATYDEWGAIGNEGWSWKECYKYFKKQEALDDIYLLQGETAQHHCTNGLLGSKHRYTETDLKTQEDFLISIFEEIGINKLPELNTFEKIGVASIHLRINSDSPSTRASTAQNYLLPIKYRNNIFLLKNSLVTKLLLEENQVTGVKVTVADKTELSLYVNKEVIVSAGTYNSPKLLQLSGIGPKNDLEKLGINVVVDLPVGENLMDHTCIPFGISGNKSSSASHEKLASAEKLQTVPIPLVSGGFSVTADEVPDIQHITFLMGASNIMLFYILYKNLNYDTNVALSFIKHSVDRDMIFSLLQLQHAESYGKVTLRSTNPHENPLIYHNFLSNEKDLERLVAGVKKMAELKSTTLLSKVGAEITFPQLAECDHLEKASDDYWRCYTKNTVSTGYHPTGTCKMAPKTKGGVVDARLNVHGIKGLRVVDESIMPRQPVSKTAAVAVMIGERAADFIKEDYNRTIDNFVCRRDLNKQYLNHTHFCELRPKKHLENVPDRIVKDTMWPRVYMSYSDHACSALLYLTG